MKLTGISSHFSAAHTPLGGGPLHGHTWLVTVWVEYCGDDAELMQVELDQCLAPLDHTELPRELTCGEDLAEHIGLRFAGAVQVDLSRPAERIHARWVA